MPRPTCGMDTRKPCPSKGKAVEQFSKTFITPVGELLLTTSRDSVLGLVWKKEPVADTEYCPLLREAGKQLKEYFAGNRKDFDLPMELNGTPFQKRVWKELQNIPFGKTWSYRDLAERTGSPGAVRAVGT